MHDLLYTPEVWDLQVGRRQLKQAQIQRASASLDLSCTGCPAEDVRQQITQTTAYPYSAVGELLGGLPTSKTCDPDLNLRQLHNTPVTHQQYTIGLLRQLFLPDVAPVCWPLQS